MWQVISGAYLGWALGANDASNVFGTAVASRMLRFGSAAAICAVFIIIGAFLEGSGGMHTYASLSATDLNSAFIVSLTAALTVTVMTGMHLPVSTSQAVVGALVAAGMYSGSVNFGALTKVVLCWVGTPFGAMLLAIILYPLLGKVLNRLALNVYQYDIVLRWGLIIAGAYGAYALGANNVANATGAFVGEGMLSVRAATLIGGFAIALGVITFSRGVMMTVGRGLVKLDAYSALIVVIAEAVTVHIYAMVGVPVSTSQAVVGAVLGIGIVRSVKTVNRQVLKNILLAWVSSPFIAFMVAVAGFWFGVWMGWM